MKIKIVLNWIEIRKKKKEWMSYFLIVLRESYFCIDQKKYEWTIWLEETQYVYVGIIVL